MSISSNDGMFLTPSLVRGLKSLPRRPLLTPNHFQSLKTSIRKSGILVFTRLDRASVSIRRPVLLEFLGYNLNRRLLQRITRHLIANLAYFPLQISGHLFLSEIIALFADYNQVRHVDSLRLQSSLTPSPVENRNSLLSGLL